jgi:hypothetical protein
MSRAPITPHQPLQCAGLAHCRSCSGSTLATFLDLRSQPVANALLEKRQLGEPEPNFPLELAFCHSCGLVQITETIPPDVLFGRDCPYYSSSSPALLAHSRDHVRRILAERALVIEVAGNDGYLRSNFVEADIPVLGIDPAAATKRGVPTMQAFFGMVLALQLVLEGKSADVYSPTTWRRM